mgnify:CR=1 FL=1
MVQIWTQVRFRCKMHLMVAVERQGRRVFRAGRVTSSERAPVIELPPRRIQFSVPMLMMVDPRRFYMAYMPLKAYKMATNGLQQINQDFRALDYWPLPVTRLQTRIPGATPNDLSFIATATCSYREEKWPWDIFEHEDPKTRLLSIKGFLALPHIENARAVGRVVRRTRPEVPGSAYPSVKPETINGEGFKRKVFQPTRKQLTKLRLLEGHKTVWNLIDFCKRE